MNKNYLFGIVISLAALIGCQSPTTTVSSGSPSTQVSASSPMDTSDLDLSTISDLVRSGKVADADTLQSAVNDPNSSINNVDLDKDGNVDPITVSETTNTEGGKQFNLVANPATGEATTVATINVNVVNNVATVQAAYPSYVSGYQDYYYTYNVSPSVSPFLMWALMPRPIWVPRPYVSYGWYAPRHIYTHDVVIQRRTSYGTQMHVSPVPKAVAPPSYVQRATKVATPNTFAKSRPAPTTNNLNDRASASGFQRRDTSRPVQKATGFGATKPSTPSTPSTPRVSAPVSKPSFNSRSTPAPRTRGRR